MAEHEPTRSGMPPRTRLAVQSFALSVLMSGIATLGIVVFRGQLHWPRFHWGKAVARAVPSLHVPSLANDQALVKVAPEPEALADTPKNQVVPERHLSASEM